MTFQPGSGEGASNSRGRDGPGGCLEAGTGITPGQPGHEQDVLCWGSCSGQILAMGAGLGPSPCMDTVCLVPTAPCLFPAQVVLL